MLVVGGCAPEDSLPRLLSVRHTVSCGDRGQLPISGLVDVDHLWGTLLKGAAWQRVHHCAPWMLPFPALPRALACTSTDGDPTSQHGEPRQ